MGKFNALSQRSDHGSGAKDNDNMVLLTPNFLAIWALKGLVMLGEEGDILKEIWWQTRDGSQEEIMVKAIKELVKSWLNLWNQWNGPWIMKFYTTKERSMSPAPISNVASLHFVMTLKLLAMLEDGKPWS
jgi:hypothetical protein